MKHRTLTPLALALAAALALGACAGKPKPAPGPVADSAAPERDTAPGGAPGGGAGGSSLQADLAATAGDRVFFDVDSYRLDTESQAALARQADWLLRHPSVRAIVAGNCDERGTREYNLALGARRAAAAKEFLIARGVGASRLETVSYGKERPIAAGSTDEAWAQNRNAQTVLIDLGPV
jgi:peptidoglycan-associated lipoprotein